VRHPATIALIAILVLSLLALQFTASALGALYDEVNSAQGPQGVIVEGEDGQTVLNRMFLQIGLVHAAIPMLGVIAAASALALVLVWCFAVAPKSGTAKGADGRRAAASRGRSGAQSSDGTRTMSAAGSTVNRADTTVPNSSPSISNSSAPSTISISTDRPRE
jgi:hypothetical protein